MFPLWGGLITDALACGLVLVLSAASVLVTGASWFGGCFFRRGFEFFAFVATGRAEFLAELPDLTPGLPLFDCLTVASARVSVVEATAADFFVLPIGSCSRFVPIPISNSLLRLDSNY